MAWDEVHQRVLLSKIAKSKQVVQPQEQYINLAIKYEVVSDNMSATNGTYFLSFIPIFNTERNVFTFDNATLNVGDTFQIDAVPHLANVVFTVVMIDGANYITDNNYPSFPSPTTGAFIGIVVRHTYWNNNNSIFQTPYTTFNTIGISPQIVGADVQSVLEINTIETPIQESIYYIPNDYTVKGAFRNEDQNFVSCLSVGDVVIEDDTYKIIT